MPGASTRRAVDGVYAWRDRVRRRTSNERAADTVRRGRRARLAEALGLDLVAEPFDLEEFRIGLNVELEHGSRSAETDVTHDDPLATAKIALAHLREIPDYYTRLVAMERQAEGQPTV